MARNKSAQEMTALAVQKPACTAIAKSEYKLRSRTVKDLVAGQHGMSIVTMAAALACLFFGGAKRKKK